mgnify:CR=1 FL=1
MVKDWRWITKVIKYRAVQSALSSIISKIFNTVDIPNVNMKYFFSNQEDLTMMCATIYKWCALSYSKHYTNH